MFYVYLLESQKNGKFYIGSTSDLRRRLIEHNKGLSKSTKYNGSWECIYYEACVEESDAKRREKYLKSNQGARLMKRRIKDYIYKKRLADPEVENHIV